MRRGARGAAGRPVGSGRGLALLRATLVLLPACDALTDTRYPGEPLVTLSGRVESTGALPPLEAAMLWQRGAPPGTDDQELATRAPVETGFPATFTLRLYRPPPAAAVRSLAPGEPTWARANAAAVPFGVAAPQVAQLPQSANPSYAVDALHWVLHLDAPVRPGSLTEWWLGGTPGAGYHLLRVTPRTRCLEPSELDACVADLVTRGVPDDGTSAAGTARGFCLQPYRLSEAPPGEPIVLRLGAPASTGAVCP